MRLKQNSIVWVHSVLWWSIFVFFPSPPLHAQQNTLRVDFENDPSRSTTMGIVRKQNTVYGSLNDLARIFSLSTYENSAARKLELSSHTEDSDKRGEPARYRVKVSAGNPFVVIADQSPLSGQRRTIYQLPLNVLHSGDGYFVPLNAFIPFFDRVFNKAINYDAKSGILHVLPTITAGGFDFSTLRMEAKSNGMLIRIPAAKPLADFESWLKQDGWLYVTIADAKADVDALNKIKPSGMVKKIVAIQSPTSVQLTFKLSGKVAGAEISKQENSNDILISVRTAGAEEKLLLESKQREIQASLESQRKRWELDVIVIDPGHGGRDYGAIGVTRVKEKDVTLGIGLKIGKLIAKKLPDVKVVYTRTGDSFVELDRRGRIANESDGKLFISIHCNSLKRKPSPTRGFEVYLLRPGRTAEAVAIAERENSVIELEEGYEDRYKELTEENFILVTMAQSAHVKASELFADIAQREMEGHLNIPNRGVKQAGFYVLVGASMPNVLVETAYLSNREDERFLASDAGQRKIAEALFVAVRRYKDEYEKLLLEGKEIGER
jgi:N-acetylmuramoyl-L-alanine amidase